MSYVSEVLADAPLFYGRLGESSGASMLDSSGSGRHGSYLNSPTLGVAGALLTDSNTAATFNGTNQYGEVSSATWMDTSALTAEAWVKTTETTGIRSILDRYGASGQRVFQFRLNAGRVEFLRQTSGGSNTVVTTTQTVSDGNWHHVAATYDGSNYALYIDGTQVLSGPLSGGMRSTSTTPLRVAVSASATGVNQHFPGSLDEVAYYGTALVASRLDAHYQAAVTAGLPLGDVQFNSTTSFVAVIGLTTPPSAALGPLDFVSSTTMQLRGLGVPGAFFADFAGSSSLTAQVSPAKDFGGDFLSASSMVFDLDPPPLTMDPITGLAPYRVLLVDMYGTQMAEIENASLGPVKWSINDKGNHSFTVPANDPKIRELSVPEQEVQVWRGGRMLWWGVIVRARATDEQVEFQCQTLEWYFDRRLVGPVPRTGVFEAPGLQYRVRAWTRKVMPGSTPHNLPVVSLSREQSIAGGKSLAVTTSGGVAERVRSADEWFTTAKGAVLSATGISQLTSIVNETFGDSPTINVNVYHDNTEDWKEAKQFTQARWEAIADFIRTIKADARVGGQGYGERHPVATNSTSAGREENRRVKITFRDSVVAKGHQQYISQSYEIRVPSSSAHRLKAVLRGWVYIEEFAAAAANHWGLVIERQDLNKPHKDPKMAEAGYKKVYSRKYIPISKATPKNRWIRMEAALMVPNDGKKYVIEGRFFPPSGLAYFDEADLYFDDSLDYQNEEQAHIMRDLIDHAQDTNLGKTDLNIGKRIRKTGVKRTRRYFYGERTVVGDHLNEFTTLGDGMEWEVKTTPTERTVVSYYPRKERKTGYVLALGQNVAAFDVDVDGDSTANVVVVMANDVEAYAREERAVVDMSLIEGVALEKAYMATPGTNVGSLRAQARRGIERYRKPTVIPTVRGNPAFTNEMLRRVQTGDVVLVDVRSGWYQTQTEYRVLDMTLDPSSEELSFTLMPEDTPIKVLSGWEEKWKYTSQAQTNSTGSQNGSPKETNKTWAARDFDDSGWSVGRAGFGWYDDGDDYSQQVSIEPKTELPVGHEVWMRKTVLCTEEMYLSIRGDQFAYAYVNGNLVGDRHRVGNNFGGRFNAVPIRVPQEYLDPSGQQVVTVHVQDRLKDRPESPAALYADCKVRGIYNPNHVGA